MLSVLQPVPLHSASLCYLTVCFCCFVRKNIFDYNNLLIHRVWVLEPKTFKFQTQMKKPTEVVYFHELLIL